MAEHGENGQCERSLSIVCKLPPQESIDMVAATHDVPGVVSYTVGYHLGFDALAEVSGYIRKEHADKQLLLDPRDEKRDVPPPDEYTDMAKTIGAHAVLIFQSADSMSTTSESENSSQQEHPAKFVSDQGLKAILAPIAKPDAPAHKWVVDNALAAAKEQDVRAFWFRANPYYRAQRWRTSVREAYEHIPDVELHMARVFSKEGQILNNGLLALFGDTACRFHIGDAVCESDDKYKAALTVAHQIGISAVVREA
jgi:hypothetical protein